MSNAVEAGKVGPSQPEATVAEREASRKVDDLNKLGEYDDRVRPVRDDIW